MTIIRNILIKIIVIICITYLFAFPPQMNRMKTQTCTNDKSFDFTKKLNDILRVNVYLRKFMQIIIFSFLDFLILLISFYWVIYGKNWRLIMSLSIFFSLREFFNFSYELISNEDMIWAFPGINSFTVSYLGQKDFFFSGSCGLYTLCILEIKDSKFYKFNYLSVFFMLAHIILLVSLRAQYLICIIMGVICSHYAFILGHKYCNVLNDLYDFDTELTNSKKEEKLKNIIIQSIHKCNNLPNKNNYANIQKSTDEKNTEMIIEFPAEI